MSRFTLLSALAVAAPLSFAQTPPKLEPLPPVPPPPPGVSDIPADEPRVRIAPEAESVEEVREGDRVIGYRVTPRGGVPYFLVDTTGNGNWMRRDSLDDGVRAPMWPLFRF
jgi:hypothetical protein